MKTITLSCCSTERTQGEKQQRRSEEHSLIIKTPQSVTRLFILCWTFTHPCYSVVWGTVVFKKTEFKPNIHFLSCAKQ